ncbi:hypothetical protein AMELA_G00053690 [Ameiurus melas]|uniref:RGS domain-containing protein n=1 Tax=Ameiurus melas TaxID=219545 RepID=A0A7J6B609_AMEME|nr:hypothetical protein AMELA_G00053690 [Ameiurus melas]
MPQNVSRVEMRKQQQAHIEGPPQAPGHPRPNTCCLCWCGCCKCLWNEESREHPERQTCTKMDSIEATEEQIIYEDYVSILSPKEVSLDSRVREGINQSLAEPSSLMYEEAQLQIYTLMHRDSFPRFLNSSVYRDLLERKRACLDT